MFKKKIKNKKMLGPVITIIIMSFLLIILSAIFSLLGITGNQTSIVNGSLETSLTTVNNVLTAKGIKYLFNNVITNFQIFEPVTLLVISLITMSIGEASGLFKALFSGLKKINSKFLTFIVLLLGIASSFLGEYSYIFLLPMVAIMYQVIGKKPLLGIVTVFLGITIGYGTGLVFNNEEVILSFLTEQAAAVDIDKDYIYALNSNSYIMFVSTFILAIVGTFIIHAGLDKKIPKSDNEPTKDLIISKKALLYSSIAFGIMLLVLIYMIIPGLGGSGILLGDGKSYIEQLLGESSPFYTGFTFLILVMMMICSFIYGYVSGNIKNSTEYSVALSKNFEGCGYVFVLLFFTSQMLGILEWTNLGTVIASNLVSFMSTLSFSGFFLILMLFIVVILMTILIPAAPTKWGIAAPLLVPLLMRSNITPSFAQFIFRAADGVGKAFTPFFAYYIIMLALLEKYNAKDNDKITVFGTLKTLLPSIFLFMGLWLLIILGWYLIGIPTGPGVYSTF